MKEELSFILFFLLISFVRGAEAFGWGDFIAIIIFLAIFFIGILACLGWYAKRNGYDNL